MWYRFQRIKSQLNIHCLQEYIDYNYYKAFLNEFTVNSQGFAFLIQFVCLIPTSYKASIISNDSRKWLQKHQLQDNSPKYLNWQSNMITYLCKKICLVSLAKKKQKPSILLISQHNHPRCQLWKCLLLKCIFIPGTVMHVNSNFLKVLASNCAIAKNYYAHSILIMNHYDNVFVVH